MHALTAAQQAAATRGDLGITVLLLCLGTGIIVGIKSKKLTVTELLICGGFGLCLAATSIGINIMGSLNGGVGSLIGMLQ